IPGRRTGRVYPTSLTRCPSRLRPAKVGQSRLGAGHGIQHKKLWIAGARFPRTPGRRTLPSSHGFEVLGELLPSLGEALLEGRTCGRKLRTLGFRRMEWIAPKREHGLARMLNESQRVQHLEWPVGHPRIACGGALRV